jgi:hypothetical protein
MNFTFTWILDKFGFAPKANIDLQEWPFPVKKEIKSVAKKATKVAKKTTSVKIPKATTRTSKTKK